MTDPRQPGELLWPERYDQKYLDAHRANLGPLFEALFQQRPFPLGGNLFKEPWFRGRFRTGEDCFHFEDGSYEPFTHCPRFAVMDPATGKNATKGDYTVIGSFACVVRRNPPLLLCLNMARDRYPLEDLLRDDPRSNVLAREVTRWGASFLDVEDTGFQVTIARLARQCLSIAVREVPTEGKSKLVRALPAIGAAEAGQVLLPEGATWAAGFVERLCEWSGEDGEVDDEIDVLANAVRRFRVFGYYLPTKMEKGEKKRPQESAADSWDDERRDYARERLGPRHDSTTRRRGLFGAR